MIRSMTGFGEGTSDSGGITVSVTAKSVNSRFLEIGVKIPDILGNLEHRLNEIASRKLSRGKLFLNVSINYVTKTDIYNVTFDKPLLDKYMETLKSLEYFSGDVGASDLAALPDVLISSPREDFSGRVEALLVDAAEKAMDGLLAMRISEGAAIEKDIRGRLEAIEESVELLSEKVDMSREHYLERLRDRIALILEGKTQVDDDRLLQEAAYLAQKSDPTEEITRLKSHICQFLEALSADEPVGSRLRFILQECNREADTIGAKGDTAETSAIVIAVKEQLERIREQVHNVE